MGLCNGGEVVVLGRGGGGRAFLGTWRILTLPIRGLRVKDDYDRTAVSVSSQLT